jgi:deazaflavin-dependent oxidoreductase (nitroreductase family)
MTINITCGPSGAVITGETEDELVSNMQAYARAHDNTEPSRERILVHIRGTDPTRPIDRAAWAALTAPTPGQKLCDTSDMVIVHRMFRRECALLPQLVAAVAGGDLARARTVAGHAREILDMLHHHHVGEDELLWPRLAARTRFHADLLARMDSQHQSLAVLLEHAATSFTAWQNAPTASSSTALTALLQQLSAGLNEHFDEEEATVLPIVEQVITAAEYQEVGRRGLMSIPPTRRLIMLGYLLEGGTRQERRDFLAAVPAPARLAYRLIGARQHRHETTRLRDPLHRRTDHGLGGEPARPAGTAGRQPMSTRADGANLMTFDTPHGTRGARQPGGRLMAWMNDWNMKRIRANATKVMGMQALVLTTVGAKSGTPRHTPVAYFSDGPDSWLIVASANGAAKNPAWYYNLAAHPNTVQIQIAGRTVAVSAEQLHGNARQQAWRQITSAADRFAKYEQKTDRELPVIRLHARPNAKL